MDRTYLGLRKILECKDKDQCKDRNCGLRHGDQPQEKGLFKQWIKDQNIARHAKVSQNTNPPPNTSSSLMQTNIWDEKRIIEKYKLPERGKDNQKEVFTPVATKEVAF